jgi:hypothetical protein
VAPMSVTMFGFSSLRSRMSLPVRCQLEGKHLTVVAEESDELVAYSRGPHLGKQHADGIRNW